MARPSTSTSALTCNFPEMIRDLREGAWHVVRGEDIDNGISLGEEDLNQFRLGNGDLHIVPYVAGSKRGGVLKIILGVALIGVGLFMGAATPILGGMLGGATYGNLAMFGAAMALSGVAQMISPQEKAEEKSDQSFTFSGPGNAYEQGWPVPAVFGEVITGGVLVSGGTDIEQLGN
jgi:predicted phage tail protein